MKKRKTDPRDGIRTLELIRMLEQHVLEGAALKATQVTAALALLKKVLPDLGSRETGEAAFSYEDALRELE